VAIAARCIGGRFDLLGVAGNIGVGKTSLTERLAARLGWKATRVLDGWEM
jgi:uridine kinase